MRYTSLLFSSLSLLGLLIFAGCNQAGSKQPAPVTSAPIASAPGATGKIAYVNIDSLESKYELLKAKREEFKHRQEQMESELQRSYMQMESDAQEVEKKARANNLTQSEYETATKRLNQQEQSLKSRKESLTDQLVKEQDDFNKDLKSRLDAFLAEYNKTRHYDYILSYSYAGSSLLYVNKQLDITQDVIDGMNASAKK